LTGSTGPTGASGLTGSTGPMPGNGATGHWGTVVTGIVGCSGPNIVFTTGSAWIAGA
jgi:hypothetical protein